MIVLTTFNSQPLTESFLSKEVASSIWIGDEFKAGFGYQTSSVFLPSIVAIPIALAASVIKLMSQNYLLLGVNGHIRVGLLAE